jgi:hypothetical protein
MPGPCQGPCSLMHDLHHPAHCLSLYSLLGQDLVSSKLLLEANHQVGDWVLSKCLWGCE